MDEESILGLSMVKINNKKKKTIHTIIDEIKDPATGFQVSNRKFTFSSTFQIKQKHMKDVFWETKQ
jgi:hypothetical protein